MNEKSGSNISVVGFVEHFYPVMCGTITCKKGRHSTANLINVFNIYKYNAANISWLLAKSALCRRQFLPWSFTASSRYKGGRKRTVVTFMSDISHHAEWPEDRSVPCTKESCKETPSKKRMERATSSNPSSSWENKDVMNEGCLRGIRHECS